MVRLVQSFTSRWMMVCDFAFFWVKRSPSKNKWVETVLIPSWYLFVHHSRIEHFSSTAFCVFFFKGKFQSSQLQIDFLERNAESCFQTQNKRLSNLDFNIDQENLDYDFFHNLAALLYGQCAGRQVVYSIYSLYAQSAGGHVVNVIESLQSVCSMPCW